MPRNRRLAVEPLESRQLLATLLGLTANNTLVTFDSSQPGQPGVPIAISGLQGGDSIVAIDTRQATSQVYGLSNTGRLYAIDPADGAATRIGPGPIGQPLSGTEFDIEFLDANTIRIVSDTGQSLRVSAETAGIISTDGELAYAPTDPGNGTTPDVRAAGWYNGYYLIDAKRGTMDVANANDLLTTYTSLGTTLTGAVGMDFSPTGALFISATPAGASSSSLYTLTNGQGPLTRTGVLGGGVVLRDLTVLTESKIVYAVTTENRLISFRSSTPSDLVSSHPILGLQPGEVIGAIAFRPSSGGLYGFGSTGRLYAINPQTGTATAISTAPITPAYDGSKPSITFIASLDRIRLVTKSGQDLRINPDSGVVDEVENPLVYAAGDPSSSFLPAVVSETEATLSVTFNGQTIFGTGLFGIDSQRDTLVRSLDPPPSGRLGTNAPLGRDVTDDVGLDTSPPNDAFTGVTLASLTDAGATSSTLYRIYPSLVSSSTPPTILRIGDIAGGAIVRDIAIAPVGNFGFASSNFSVSEDAGVATITVTRTGGSSGSATLRYISSGGTARAGVDYTPVNGLISFADGETLKTFAVPIRNGAFDTGSRTVGITLYSDPSAMTSVASTTLTIVVPPATLTPGVASTTFLGGVTAIATVTVTFKGPVDGARAVVASNYVLRAIRADRKGTVALIPITAASYDPNTLTARLTLASPLALSAYRSVQVTASGFGPNGTDSSLGYNVLQGTIVRYVDADGDRVALAVAGRKSRLVVLRQLNGASVSAWVEGRGLFVTGLVIPKRGSNHKAVIDRFVTNGAKLRLTRQFTVNQVVTS